MKKINQKLNISDFVFEYKSQNFDYTSLSYKIEPIKRYTYENNQLNEEKQKIISFEINAEDKNKNTCEFIFSVKYTLKQLNDLEEGLININDKIIEGELYDNGQFKFVDNNFGTIYKSLTTLYQKEDNYYIAKLNQNKFLFKIQHPNLDLFIWFEIDFSKEAKNG